MFVKHEDLNHTGSHKITNVLGQALLARRMGKPRVIAETGAGSHGVATATACALSGLECVVYMGEVDMERQALNVARMRMPGTKVVPVTSGSRTLKDAINEAFRDRVANVESTHYLFGTAAGPHPSSPFIGRPGHVGGGRAGAPPARWRPGRGSRRCLAGRACSPSPPPEPVGARLDILGHMLSAESVFMVT